MSMTASSPYWWQRLFPRYGNWGGIGWSAGIWNNDPALTDWSISAIDEMDELFKWHDWAYQHGCDLDAADWNLVHDLGMVCPQTVYGKFYRLLAMTAFTAWPKIRWLIGDIAMDKRKYWTAAIAVVVTVLWVSLFKSVVFGGDVGGVTAADFDSPEAHWIWSLLANDTVHTAILWILGSGVAAVLGWVKWQGTRKAKAIQCLAAGVRETYEAYVRPAKQASEDGKLDDDERREAVRQAIERGKEIALTFSIDLVKILGKELLPMLVDWLVRLFKGEASASKVAPLSPPQLPDLEPSLPSE